MDCLATDGEWSLTINRYNEELICGHCNGSGEGMRDATRCGECRGLGTIQQIIDHRKPCKHCAVMGILLEYNLCYECTIEESRQDNQVD